MRKTIICGLLSAALIISMAGCQSGGGASQSQASSGAASVSPAPQSSQPFTNAGMDDLVAGVESGTTNSNSNSNSNSGQAGVPTPNPGSRTLERQVIYNQIPEIGKTVYFGAYEQDNDLSNGYEPIEWIVLRKFDGDNTYLLMSLHCLDQVDYDMSDKVSVKESGIIKWMNEEFYMDAFNDEERAFMANYQTNYNGKNVTDFHVSLMSPSLIKGYLKNDNARKAKATPYAKARGAEIQGGQCWYWLFPDMDKGVYPDDYAAAVSYDGSIVNKISITKSTGGAVRPVITVHLDDMINH